MIFAVKVDRSKTEGGVILPESHEEATPLAEIVAAGSNITQYKKGDVVYLVPEYMRYCEIDSQKCIVTFEDGILGVIPKESDKDD